MRIKTIILFWSLSFSLYSCATTNIARQVMETRVIWESEKPKPAWINDYSSLPGQKESYEYFFGISGKFSEERGARDDALVNAVKNAVRYIGIDMKIDREQIITVNQKSMDIITPEIKSEERETAISEALIRGIKPYKWYIVQKENYMNNSPMGSFYEIYVSVEVSKKHIDNAMLEWEKRKLKKKREEAERRKKEPLEDLAEKLVDELALSLKKTSPENTVIPIVIGNFTYGSSGCSGEFVEDFKDLVEGKASVHKAFKVKGRVRIKDIVGRANLDPNLETGQATIMNANILHGKYSDNGKQVIVTAYLTDEREHVSSSTVSIEKTKITKKLYSKGCEKNRDIIAKIEPLKEPDFSFRLWTDNAGGIYKTGDKISINFQCSERCYVKIFNIDRNGAVSVLEDTRDRRLLKNKKHTFETMTLYAGVETIIAIASTDRFAFNNTPNEIIPTEEFPITFGILRRTEGKKAEYKTTLTVVDKR